MDVLNENHYFINDYSLLNLLLHIAIAINRVQNGCVYTEAPVLCTRWTRRMKGLRRS